MYQILTLTSWFISLIDTATSNRILLPSFLSYDGERPVSGPAYLNAIGFSSQAEVTLTTRSFSKGCHDNPVNDSRKVCFDLILPNTNYPAGHWPVTFSEITCESDHSQLGLFGSCPNYDQGILQAGIPKFVPLSSPFGGIGGKSCDHALYSE